MLLDVFIKGDVYIDYPFEAVKFRYDKKSGKVYRRFYGEAEEEIPHSSDLYNQAIRTGKQITPEEYFRDPSSSGSSSSSSGGGSSGGGGASSSW